MSRIVLTTVGSLGDLHPFLALGRELRARGHDVVLATHGIYRDAAARAGLAFHPMRPDAGDWGDEAEVRRRAIDERSGSEYVVRALVLPFVRESYADLTDACEGADVIVSHMLLFSAALAAEKLRLPRAHVMLQPAAMLSAYDPMPPPGMMRPPPFSPAAWKVLWRLARISTRPWFRDLEAFRSELGLAPIKGHPFFDSYSPDLNLALFSKLLAPPQPDWPPRTVQTGFPFDDHGSHGHKMPPALETFLDSGPAPVVFTLGSTGVWDPGNFYREAAQASERLGVRAVLLTGFPGGADSALPPDVVAHEYAPHRELFARAAVNVHHGGVGTTAEALRAGRPMVIVPFSHDQPDNARRCIELGVARAIRRNRARADRLAREVRAVLDDPAMAEKARQVGEQIRAEPGVRAAADAIEALED